MAPVLERDVEAYLIKRIKDIGGEIRKARWIGVDGCPDRRVLGYGWVEVKAPDGVLSARQLREIAKMTLYGEKVDILYTKNDVDDYVARLIAKLSVEKPPRNVKPI